MKACLFVVLLSSFSLYATEPSMPVTPQTPQINMEALSETLGHLLVRHLGSPVGFEFSLEKIIQGMRDELANKPSPLTEEQYEQMIGLIQEKIIEETAARNLAQANQFLEENKNSKDVIVLNEKLHYKVLEAGSGSEKVTHESSPLIHYEGRLIDGTPFASSLGSEPIVLPIAQTIEGFSKGLTGMSEGEKRVLYIHPDLAYGVDGHLPPNSLLVFEVTIVKVDGTQD
jgi:peptidylprolyl isomerase